MLEGRADSKTKVINDDQSKTPHFQQNNLTTFIYFINHIFIIETKFNT